ncbi:Bystin-domain-containing protein [Lentinula aff. lateritia]|uniref:Bystin-domain-containing protein n=1 Tax=Lentinula aff. lateritia TaxID=2804960 RepID=A0ACC1TTV3_9AGAR|nr:Bystin-domain-containing protein [Lentinula aff. lateritia]
MPHTTKFPVKSCHNPLLAQLDDDEREVRYGRISEPGRCQKPSKKFPEDNENVALDPKTSRRILELAKTQQDELDALDKKIVEDAPQEWMVKIINAVDGDEDGDDGNDSDMREEMEEIFEIDPDDMETLDALLPHDIGQRRTLADIIFSKLDENGAIHKVQQKDRSKPDPALGLDPMVVEMYTKLGLYLSKYKSGSLPKLFKVIPTFPTWARILALTEPENWSPHACRAATRIFISTMKPAQAQLFLSVVLLEAVRKDIRENKKLNVQYYEALKRALYKPSAFFKGILFPMLNQGCTLREAAIMASILAKVKIPVLHASAALLHIAEMDYTGPNSLFIRVLIDKKFNLPFKVVDTLVFHFIRLSNTYKPHSHHESEHLPVLWHQSLLAFMQRYTSDLTPDQKDALLDVRRATSHPQISTEVRRELVNSIVRGAPKESAHEDVEMA